MGEAARHIGPERSAVQVPPPEQSRAAVEGKFKLSPLAIFAAFFCVSYLGLYYRSIAPYWFHPGWTTDDALQQIYPFHEVYHPGVFAGDLITTMMKCYLAPIHYWLGMGITYLTADPIMSAHWMMLIQLGLSATFLFLAIRSMAGVVPAFFSVAWLFHTRNVIQRLTAGLPRGWAEVVFTGYLYLALTKRYRTIIAFLAVGCLLHPPATLLVALGHGMFLAWRFFLPATRADYKRPFLTYVLVSPLLALLALSVTQMPPEIGTMANYERASKMPEFQEPKGRFPFLPLKSAAFEIRGAGFQAFLSRFYNPGRFWKEVIPPLVLASVAALLLIGFLRKRTTVPTEVLFFFVAALIIYFASRQFVFKLYVPNRHIQFPFATFFIFAFSIGAWRAFLPGSGELTAQEAQTTKLSRCYGGVLGLVAVATLVFIGSHLNLGGTANFNYAIDKRGGAFKWLKEHTPESSLVAGEPTLVDPTQLFAIRRTYVTTETSHPFYDKYYNEMSRRLDIALRAHYAASLKELIQITEPEKIDYFLFDSKIYSSPTLADAKYFPPFDKMVETMAARPASQFAYRELPESVDIQKFPFMPYKDRFATVIDLAKLKEYLKTEPGSRLN